MLPRANRDLSAYFFSVVTLALLLVVSPFSGYFPEAVAEEGGAISLVPSGYFSLRSLSINQVGRMPNLSATVMVVADRGTMLVRLNDQGDPERTLLVYIDCDTTGFVTGHVLDGGKWHRVFKTEIFIVDDTRNVLEGFREKTTYVLRPCSATEVDRVIEIESERARLKSSRKDEELKNSPEYRLALAKQRFWSLAPSEREESQRPVKSLTGRWWNGLDGAERREMIVTQSSEKNTFTATCDYRHSSGEQVKWRLNGTIDKNGYISGRLNHIKAPKGWVSQTQIAVLSNDGNTIQGSAIFDQPGGHDFVWTRREKRDDKDAARE